MSTTSGTLPQAPAERSNGLATYVKVLYAPSEAFATLARIPTWGWAAIGGIVLTLIATMIGLPAILHLIQAGQQKALEQLPADQAAAQRQILAKVPHAVYVGISLVQAFVIPWLVWLFGAVIFAIGAALGGGEARFKPAWVGAVNLYIIGALGAVVSYVIVALRGAENVSSAADLFALPSPAMLLHGSVKFEAFLNAFNVVNIWSYVVTVIALEHLMKMNRTAAIVTVVVLALLGGGIAAAFAK
jgi:hypothetical protein